MNCPTVKTSLYQERVLPYCLKKLSLRPDHLFRKSRQLTRQIKLVWHLEQRVRQSSELNRRFHRFQRGSKPRIVHSFLRLLFYYMVKIYIGVVFTTCTREVQKNLNRRCQVVQYCLDSMYIVYTLLYHILIELETPTRER